MRSDFNEIVKSYLGTYEVTNKEVVGQFFKGARNSWITRTSEKFSSRYAWCAAFIYTMLKKAGKEPKYMPTAETIRAKSYIPEENGGLFKGTSILLDEAKEGDIIVLKRGKNMYHVGTYVSHEKGFIVVRGGNQNNRVKESKYLESALVDIVDYDSI
jgi:uncharacterized protein (TIGR02594 family)